MLTKCDTNSHLWNKFLNPDQNQSVTSLIFQPKRFSRFHVKIRKGKSEEIRINGETYDINKQNNIYSAKIKNWIEGALRPGNTEKTQTKHTRRCRVIRWWLVTTCPSCPYQRRGPAHVWMCETPSPSCLPSALCIHNNNNNTRLTALFRDYPGVPVPERQNQSGFYWSKRQWVAVASAGPYASLHLTPDR